MKFQEHERLRAGQLHDIVLELHLNERDGKQGSWVEVMSGQASEHAAVAVFSRGAMLNSSTRIFGTSSRNNQTPYLGSGRSDLLSLLTNVSKP